MTALILQATPFVEMVATKMQSLCLRFARALDAFAAERARKAVPERRLRNVQREVNRYQRLMRPELKSSAEAARAGR